MPHERNCWESVMESEKADISTQCTLEFGGKDRYKPSHLYCSYLPIYPSNEGAY